MILVPRSAYYRHCLEQLARAVPYVWGGRRDDGLDCSGFVVLALFKASEGRIDWRKTHNTDTLWTTLPRISEGEVLPGDLALYWGPAPKDANDVSHVMVCAGAGMCFGQAWGGPADTDAKRSRELGHVTKVMPVHYRADLAGFVRPPVTP
ncbi:MAG: NlpC/P60 family protein [Myxococcota bacterium]